MSDPAAAADSAPRLEATSSGRLVLSGALTVSSVPAVWDQRARLMPHDGQPVVLDLGGVERLDSAGLALLLSLLREARKTGSDLQFANIPSQLTSLARVSGVEGLLPRTDD